MLPQHAPYTPRPFVPSIPLPPAKTAHSQPNIQSSNRAARRAAMARERKSAAIGLMCKYARIKGTSPACCAQRGDIVVELGKLGYELVAYGARPNLIVNKLTSELTWYADVITAHEAD